MIQRALIASVILLTLTANARANNGATANGCTYQVINGQYLYSCEAKKPNPELTPSTTPTVAPVAEAPVQQQVQPQTMMIPIAPPPQQNVANDTVSTISASPETSSSKSMVDAIYVGAEIGSASIIQNSDSTMSLGVNVSANVDENMGFEIGYTYAKQDVYLGLANRAGMIPAPTGPFGANQRNITDATLSAHLLSGEMQFFLTDYYKKLRPYAGVGLGWKHSSLSENSTGGYGMAAADGSLSQNSVGLVASLGAKVQVAKNFLAAIAFRAYRPFSTQNPTLNSGSSYAFGGPSTTNSRLTTTDSNLTEAGLYQIVGGVSVAF